MANISIDFGPIAEFVAAMEGVRADVGKSSFLSELTERMRQRVAEEFGDYMDAAALANSSELHHVYEWGELGSEQGRLFRMIYTRGTRSGHLQAGYEFLPSSALVPQQQVPGDTRTKRFVFAAKAWMFELGHRVQITGDPLAFPVDGEMIFRQHATVWFDEQATSGAFERYADMFYSTIAEPLARRWIEDAMRDATRSYEGELANRLRIAQSPRRPASKTRFTINLNGLQRRKIRPGEFTKHVFRRLK